MNLSNKKLMWNDPDLIPGKDYRITSIIFEEDNDTAIITYNKGASEAEVYLHEIEVIKK